MFLDVQSILTLKKDAVPMICLLMNEFLIWSAAKQKSK